EARTLRVVVAWHAGIAVAYAAVAVDIRRLFARILGNHARRSGGERQVDDEPLAADVGVRVRRAVETEADRAIVRVRHGNREAQVEALNVAGQGILCAALADAVLDAVLRRVVTD